MIRQPKFLLAGISFTVVAVATCATAPIPRTQKDANKSSVDLGNQYARDGLLREAVATYRSALEKQPTDAVAHRNLGLVLVKIGDYKGAVTELVEAVKTFENDFDANFFLGEAYRGLDQYAEAIYQYQRALKIQPGDQKALKALSWSYFNIRFYSESLATARKLYDLYPDDVQSSIIVARTLLKLKRPKDAYRVLKGTRQRADRQSLPFVLAIEGSIRADLGQWEKAREAFAEALKTEPLLASALLGMGRCHLELKQHDKAVSYLERATRVKPKLKEAYYYLGQAYEPVDPKRAARAYQTFSKLAATDPEFVGLVDTLRSKSQNLKAAGKAASDEEVE